MRKDYNVKEIYFSARGNTEKVIKNISAQFSGEKTTFDLLRNPLKEILHFDSDSLAIVGMPVYAGRIPSHCAEMLLNFKGHKTPVIAVVVYGNRAYEDALLELTTVLESNDLCIIGAAALIAQHSIFTSVASDRPNANDLLLIDKFTTQCIEKLEHFSISSNKMLNIKGNFPYRDTSPSLLKPTGDEKCVLCGKCVKICPMNSIALKEPQKTNKDTCISCTACINACPQKARGFHDLSYIIATKAFENKNSEPKEPEFFI